MRSLVKLLLTVAVRYRPPVELVVLFVLVATLLSIAAPAIVEYRERARQNELRHRMAQIGLSVHNYHDTFGHFPSNPSMKPAKPVPVTRKKTELISPLLVLPSGMRSNGHQ